MLPSDQLSSYVEALRPIIYIHHFDFDTIDKLIADAARSTAIYEFNLANGHVDFTTKCQKQPYDLQTFLTLFDENPSPDQPETNSFLVLKDVHQELSKPEIIAQIKSIGCVSSELRAKDLKPPPVVSGNCLFYMRKPIQELLSRCS